MVYELITNAMVVLIIIIMSSTAYDSFKCKYKRGWLDYIIGTVSILWVVFYVYVLLAEPTNSSVIGQIIVRPLNVIMFSLFNILVKMRLVGRSHGNC